MLDRENGLIEVILVHKYVSISWLNIYFILIPILAVIQSFSITEINSTAVRADWGSVTGASHFIVYYQSTSKRKRQADSGARVFPGDTTNGVIGGLDPSLDYLFSISASYNINRMIFEGQRSQPIPTGMGLGYFSVFYLIIRCNSNSYCSIKHFINCYNNR